MVVTGNPCQEIAERCEGFDASCIQKGHNSGTNLRPALTAIYPQRADCNNEVGASDRKEIEVKQRPRILLWDDDINVKKIPLQGIR